MAAIVNYRDLLLQSASTRFVNVNLPTNILIPALKQILLSAPYSAFHVDAGGAGTPASITITAKLVMITGTVSWSVTSGTATLTPPTGLSTSVAFSSMTSTAITVRASVTDTDGTVYTADFSIAKVVDGATGSTGPKTALARLYQWATVQPGDPSGTSTFTFATGASSGYSGGNGWQNTVPSNPGTPGIKLWVAEKAAAGAATDATALVSWSSGFTVYAPSMNGLTGAKSATADVYQWALSIPSISGTSTYTWANASWTPNPTGWSNSIGSAPSAGYTLYKATVQVSDAGAATTTSINWALASIVAAGYVATGATGGAGVSSRAAFARVALVTPVAGNVVTASNYTFPSSSQSLSTWGFSATWGGSDPDPTSTLCLMKADAVYDPASGNTTWSTPYIAMWKVGELSAMAVNTGALTVDNVLTMGTTGSIKGGQTGYDAGTGFFQGYDSGAYKLSLGNSGGAKLTFNGFTLALGGASNLDVGGTARFNGIYTVGGQGYAVVANDGGSAGMSGLYAKTDNFDAVLGVATGTGQGVHGIGGTGVVGEASTVTGAKGVIATNTHGGVGLWISAGTLQFGTYTVAVPLGSTTTCLHNDGIWRDPVTTARVNAAFGLSAGQVLQGITTDSLTAWVDGSGIINLVSAVAGYQFQAYSTSYVKYTAVSDARIKQDIEPEEMGLAFIDKLRPVTYRLIERPEIRYHGFIAQDVEPLVDAEDDSLRMEHEDGLKGVDYLSLIGPLVKAVQELTEKVHRLESLSI